MYSPEDLGALADVVLERNLTVVADEIYERLVYPGHQFASFPTVRPGLQERTIVVNGVSKTYAMTGWRIGWALAPAERGQGDGQPAKPGNLQPVQHQPVRRPGRAAPARRTAWARCSPNFPNGGTSFKSGSLEFPG